MYKYKVKNELYHCQKKVINITRAFAAIVVLRSEMYLRCLSLYPIFWKYLHLYTSLGVVRSIFILTLSKFKLKSYK